MVAAGRGAILQIQAEAELGQHRELEPDQMRRGLAGVVEIIQRALQHLVDVFMRIALRQQPRQRGQMGHAIGRVRRRQHGGGAQPHSLDRIIAEMLVEPRPPHRAHAVAGLQQRPHPLTGPAAHQAEMAAVAARQELDNGGGFAMPPHPQHDAFVGPFHGGSLQDSAEAQLSRTASFRVRMTKLHCAIAIGNLEIPGLMLTHRPGMTTNHSALNQPWASPVKEKYSPAAVSAQETISMPLSSSSRSRR